MPRDNLSIEKAKKLADELSLLSKQQSLALQTASYLKMPKEAAAEYDARRLRIAEICEQLSKFKADS